MASLYQQSLPLLNRDRVTFHSEEEIGHGEGRVNPTWVWSPGVCADCEGAPLGPGFYISPLMSEWSPTLVGFSGPVCASLGRKKCPKPSRAFQNLPEVLG